MKILVTGASGFVGRFLCADLARQNVDFVAAVRRRCGHANECLISEVAPETDWSNALRGVGAVVHLAARVHRVDEDADDFSAEYRRVNTQATLNLARQCVDHGVKRFVFVSSVKVNGEGIDRPYTTSDVPNPVGAYAVSKWEAEQGLSELASRTGLQTVVLRPPLIYGPGVGANFGRLLRVVNKGWPLPFGLVRNRRSILYVGNMSSAIIRCIEHREAPSQTFLLHDGEPLSTSELVTAIASSIGRRVRLVPVPVTLLFAAASIVGRRDVVSRLTASLSVDDSAIRARLEWIPPYSTAAGISATTHYSGEIF